MTRAAVRRAIAFAWRAASVALPTAAAAQDSVRVLPAPSPIRLDGLPDEAAWRAADSVVAFTQTDPEEGRPATERTVVRLLATPRGLYVALWAYDDAPGAIRHAQLRRDADFVSDDWFSVVLDAQHDRRSAYIFSVNPNGAMHDAEVLSWDEANTDWNGVWDARARITSTGWTAEIWIPWQTLRYRRGSGVWGANFARLIRHKNETVLWRAWRRTEGMLFLPGEGILTGLADLPGRAPAELRPYSAATERLPDRVFAPDGSDSLADDAVATLKAGLDAKLAPAPTVTLDLTVNTDFAQVEADRQVLNLTRFPVFFPEQRPFFLEASGNFDFGQIERTSVFTSRRIGLAADGSPVPIVAGARLSGRLGRERVGLLAVRTGGAERAADFVARVRHDVLARGYVGAIVTSQSVPGVRGARLAGGIDASVPLMVHGQNLVFGGWWAASRDSTGAAAATAWRLTVDYPNDVMDHFIGVSRIQAGYDPALGFVLESDAYRTNGHIDLSPRPRHFLGVRHLHFNLLEWDITRHVDGSADQGMVGFTPIGADFQSDDDFELTLTRHEDAPRSAFEIFPGDTMPAGHYWWNRVELAFSSSAAHPVGLDVTASTGEFYTGTSTAVATTLALRAAPHVVAAVDVELQRVRLSVASFTARAGRLRFDVAATPRLGATVFLQGDNESNRLTLNGRVHWIPSPGSDVYLVYNSAWPMGLPGSVPWRRPEHGALIGKAVWYFHL